MKHLILETWQGFENSKRSTVGLVWAGLEIAKNIKKTSLQPQ